MIIKSGQEPIFHGVPLEEALRLIESETLLNPV